jgi:hypothetical protein
MLMGVTALPDGYSAGTSGLAYAAATLLANGKVLISSEPAAELYDPATDTFCITGSMVDVGDYGKFTQITNRTSALITNGKVLVAGGEPAYFDTGDYPLSSAELYDVAAGTFTFTGSMHVQRQGHVATLLADGTPLITGGLYDGFFDATNFAELYSQAAGIFSMTGNMLGGRAFHQATLLLDGRVLITGGIISNGYPQYSVLATAELYNPPTPALLPPATLLTVPVSGQTLAAIEHASTYQIVSGDNPAVAGEILVIYCTGLIDGSAIPPQVTIGGSVAEVLWFGDTPGYRGLNQINVRVPSEVAPGPSVSVRISYMGRPGNEVTIGVQ